ncbi:MAG: c-type cytochrome [Planctomycetota bacterium]|jgi:mono/diheme cytochrome c family protein
MIRTILLGACAFSLAPLAAGCGGDAAAAQDEAVARGKYLVTFGGCADCHSPKIMNEQGEPVPDPKSELSGHPAGAPYPTWSPSDMKDRNALALTNPHLSAWAGPWGVSFAANLTPDKETGLGEWTEEAFIQALRTGKHQGQPNGRTILPPMPWPTIAQATDADLKAIWAYLRSIPAIKNAVPTPVPPAGPPPGEKKDDGGGK